jgi:hypothetical protein
MLFYYQLTIYDRLSSCIDSEHIFKNQAHEQYGFGRIIIRNASRSTMFTIIVSPHTTNDPAISL